MIVLCDSNPMNQQLFSVTLCKLPPGVIGPKGLTVSHNACEKRIKRKLISVQIFISNHWTARIGCCYLFSSPILNPSRYARYVIPHRQSFFLCSFLRFLYPSSLETCPVYITHIVHILEKCLQSVFSYYFFIIHPNVRWPQTTVTRYLSNALIGVIEVHVN